MSLMLSIRLMRPNFYACGESIVVIFSNRFTPFERTTRGVLSISRTGRQKFSPCLERRKIFGQACRQGQRSPPHLLPMCRREQEQRYVYESSGGRGPGVVHQRKSEVDSKRLSRSANGSEYHAISDDSQLAFQLSSQLDRVSASGN